MNVIYPEQVGAKPLETENAESAYVPPVVTLPKTRNGNIRELCPN